MSTLVGNLALRALWVFLVFSPLCQQELPCVRYCLSGTNFRFGSRRKTHSHRMEEF